MHPRSTGSAEDPSASCFPIVGGTLLLLEYQAAQLPAPHQDMQLSAQPRQHFACRPHRPPHRLRTHLRGRGMNNYEQFVRYTIPSRSHRSMQHIAPTLHDIHQHPLLFSPFIDAAFVNSDQNLPSSLIAQIRRHMQCPDRVLIRVHCRHVALSSRMLGSCKTSVTALVTALPKARDTTGSQWNSEEKSWATCGVQDVVYALRNFYCRRTSHPVAAAFRVHYWVATIHVLLLTWDSKLQDEPQRAKFPSLHVDFALT